MAKKTNKQQEPADPSLRIGNLPGKLNEDTRKAVAGYYVACLDYESGLETLYSRHAQLYENAQDLTLKQIEEIGDQLRGSMEETAALRTHLAFRRVELLPSLLPGYQQALRDAEKVHEDVVQATIESFASRGVTVEAMPSGDTNSGRVQLRHKASQEIEVIATAHKSELRKNALTQFVGSLDTVPGWRSLLVKWPERSSKYADSVTTIAGFKDRSLHPGFPDVRGFVEIAGELGLANTLLPPRYSQPVIDLVATLRYIPGNARTVFHALEKSRRDVVVLVKKLPTTKATKEMHARLKLNTPTATAKQPRIKIKV